jgi:hypothetical protein
MQAVILAIPYFFVTILNISCICVHGVVISYVRYGEM